MALKLDERYPGRANPPSLDYPQGSFKNRTSPDAKDGTYLEQDWANDQQGFFQSLIHKAGMVASGLVDKVGASQYYDALMRLINNPEYPSLSGNATITGIDNKIVLENITPSLKLEKGDVIQIEGAGAQNEKLRTVESILSDGSIVVNYEHCGSRGNGSLKLEDFTGPVTIKRIAKWHAAGVGLGQAWVNTKPFRSAGVLYPHPYGNGRAMQISVAIRLYSPDGENKSKITDGADEIYFPVSNPGASASLPSQSATMQPCITGSYSYVPASLSATIYAFEELR